MNENLKKQLGNLTEGAMTIPNLLSVIRIILIPVFLVLFLKGSYLAAVIVLGISGLTDTLDGKIARAFNQVSNLGKLLDPINCSIPSPTSSRRSSWPSPISSISTRPTTLCCAMAAGSSGSLS